MPGQHLGHADSHPESNVRLAYIAPDVQIVRRHGTCHRRLTLVGYDGKEQHFLVQTSLTPNRADERVVQLMRHLNRLLEKHKQSRRRHLLFHTPVVVPVWPQVRCAFTHLD
jgi:transformation/transcription domain-associated protein